MACALPVVISDQVDIHREVSEAGAGLVTRCDSGEVAQALNALLCDPAARRTMSAAGRRLVSDKYTWPRVVHALTKQYKKTVVGNTSIHKTVR